MVGSEDAQTKEVYVEPWKFQRAPLFVRREFVAAVVAVCENLVFVLWTASRNDPSLPTALLAGFCTITLFFMAFDPIIVGLTIYDLICLVFL